jgi:glycosyltransferase involved in cell wall biosynthesis
MSKKLNILFLASWYPNKVTPKNGNFIQKHAEAVAAHCNVFALHIIARKQEEDFIVETEILNNVSETIVYYKKVTSSTPIFHQLLKLRIRRKAHSLGFQEILKKANKIDFVHLNVCFPAGLFALHLKKKYKLPYIISENFTVLLDSDPLNFTTIEQYFVNKINRNADMLCPVSNDLKKALQKIAPNQEYEIIPNVVNTQIFKPNITSNKIEKVQLLHLSNLKDEHKNITGIINVIKKLSESRTDFSLTIAGDGDADKYQYQIAQLNIPSGFILFEGKKTTTEVAELMGKHDAFLLFSNYENLPCVVVECLTMGLPVIGTNVGGVSEMINATNGIVIERKDEKALLDQLKILIDNINNYDKALIAENAKAIYSYEAVGLQFFKIYNKILSA